MKLLLDENIPLKIKRDILNFEHDHNVFTVADKGWRGVKNGDLLKRMLNENFDALITADKNMQYQQNFKKYKLPVLVLHTTMLTYAHLKVLTPQLEEILSTNLSTGITVIK